MLKLQIICVGKAVTTAHTEDNLAIKHSQKNAFLLVLLLLLVSFYSFDIFNLCAWVGSTFGRHRRVSQSLY